MKLKFYAKDDLMVAVPGTFQVAGQPARFAGRSPSVDADGNVSFPATESGVEVDSQSELGRRYSKLARRDGALWAANKETADACGVPFVPVKFQDGVFVVEEKKTSNKAGA